MFGNNFLSGEKFAGIQNKHQKINSAGINQTRANKG
jgi:hypothetical protein